MVRRRALQHLAARENPNEAILRVLVALVERERLGNGCEGFDVVPAFRAMFSPQLVEHLLADASVCDSKRLACLAIGSMGSKGAPYAPAMQVTAANPSNATNLALAARIALANVSALPRPDIDKVISALRDAGSARHVALGAMACCTGGDRWITDEIIRELCVIVGEISPTDTPEALMILSRVAGRSEPARDAIARALDKARADSRAVDTRRVLCEFASGLPRQGWTPTSLRQPVRLLGTENLGFDLPIQSTILLITHSIFATNDVATLAVLLKDRDPDVLCGALKICWGMGIGARDVEGEQLALLRHDYREDIRAVAAISLGAVGGNGCLAELKHHASKQDSSDMRDAIRASVRQIERYPAP